MNCLIAAWNDHESELRAWLRRRLADPAEADDFLQDLFLKALRQGERFCDLANARAWLFQVARHELADRYRQTRGTVELTDDLPQPVDESDPVDGLAVCLPRVLSELSPDDRDAIEQCDIRRQPQADFAAARGLTLSAVKSRVQRARVRLKQRLSEACQVQLDACGRVSDFVPRKAVD